MNRKLGWPAATRTSRRAVDQLLEPSESLPPRQGATTSRISFGSISRNATIRSCRMAGTSSAGLMPAAFVWRVATSSPRDRVSERRHGEDGVRDGEGRLISRCGRQPCQAFHFSNCRNHQPQAPLLGSRVLRGVHHAVLGAARRHAAMGACSHAPTGTGRAARRGSVDRGDAFASGNSSTAHSPKKS